MVEYPLTVRWDNDSVALNKFVTRELEPLQGSPPDQRELTDDELETIAACVVDRHRTNIVVRSDRERTLVVDQLRTFANGIAHPARGAKWATPTLHDAVQRRIRKLEQPDG